MGKKLYFKALKKFFSCFFIIIFIVFSAAAAKLFLQVITGGEPDIFGYRFYVVATDSMSPELEAGDVILSKAVGIDEIKTGDVITFMGTQGSQNGLLITHKVIKEPYCDSKGNLYVNTCGIKAGAPEDSPVSMHEIRAVMVGNIKVLGLLFKVIKTPAGFLLIVFLPVAAGIIRLFINLSKIRGKGQAQDN